MEVSDDLLQIKKDIHKSTKPEVHELMQTKEKFATGAQSEADEQIVVENFRKKQGIDIIYGSKLIRSCTIDGSPAP